MWIDDILYIYIYILKLAYLLGLLCIYELLGQLLSVVMRRRDQIDNIQMHVRKLCIA